MNPHLMLTKQILQSSEIKSDWILLFKHKSIGCRKRVINPNFLEENLMNLQMLLKSSKQFWVETSLRTFMINYYHLEKANIALMIKEYIFFYAISQNQILNLDSRN